MLKKIVTQVLVSPFKLAEKGGKQYIIDDVSCPAFILAFPKEIVDRVILTNIAQKLIGKPLPEEKLQIIKNKLTSDCERTDSRLGCANSNEIQRALSERNFWEALFSLHQLIEYRIRRLLVYKSSEVNLMDSVINVDPSKRKTCEEIKTFKHLVEGIPDGSFE